MNVDVRKFWVKKFEKSVEYTTIVDDSEKFYLVKVLIEYVNNITLQSDTQVVAKKVLSQYSQNFKNII